MFDIWDVECLGCGVFLGYGMFEIGDVWVLRCWGGEIFGTWDVRDVRCLGCGMFGMWDVQDVECGIGMFARMWNNNLKNPFIT